MTNFALGSLPQWEPMNMGELYKMDMPVSGIRVIEFDYIADTVVTIRAVEGDNAYIVAHGDGLNSVRFSIDKEIGLVAMGDPEADVFIRTRVATQVVKESGEVTYTSIEPRQPQNDEIRRMQLMMQLNARRREKMLMDELDAQRRRVDELYIERDRAPTLQQRQAAAATPPAPAAEPEAKPEGET